MEGDFQARLEARVRRLRDETGLTGVAVAVMTGGRLAGAAASGERRRGSGIAVTVDDRWHVGSITKSMTATLLAVLEDDGLLSADDTVSAAAVRHRDGGRLGCLYAAPSADAHRGRPGELSDQDAARLARHPR